MMNHPEILQRLLSATFICSAALLLVLALRPPLRRHGGAQLAYASWLLVPLALVASLLPYPAASLPTLSLADTATVFSTRTAAEAALGGWRDPATLVGIWLLGAASLAAWTGGRQWHFQRRLGRLWLLAGPNAAWRASEGASAGPLVLGLLRPKVVVPADFERRYTAQEQALILAHEQVHLQRGDLLAQALAAALQTVFWFNPLLHFATGRLRFDQEAACDAAVLQRHPQARAAYAAAILKVQLAGWQAPLGCQWQSGHPLRARIQLLARAAPSPAGRRTARATLALSALAACLSAWAADQVPAAAASAQGDVTAGPRYKVAFTAVNQLNGRTRVSMQMDMPVPAGKRMQLVSLRQPPPKGLNCDIAMEVQESGAGQVSIQLPFSCDGGKPTQPRLITGLGQRATIQTGSKVDGERLYTFTVTVTPWPEGTPWPQGRAASASGTP